MKNFSTLKKYEYFNTFFSSEIVTGITKKELGDMNTRTQNGKEGIKSFKKMIKTDYLFLPTPQHEDKCWYVKPDDIILNLQNCDALFLDKTLFPKNRVATIGFITGDCPILIGSDDTNSFVIHSGIYGSKINIIGKLLQEFLNKNLINIEKTKISIWGGICSKCYEVGEEWEKIFPGHIKNKLLNLGSVIVGQVIESGINIENIAMLSNKCSYESPDLFSHRKGDKERNLVFIKTLT